jgi:hypothetical protein
VRRGEAEGLGSEGRWLREVVCDDA